MAKTKGAKRSSGWRQWSEAEARGMLTALKESGDSMAAFAARRGVSTQRLSYWAKRLRNGRGETTFVPVEIPGTAAGLEASTIEISSGGLVVRIREDADPGTLQRVVDTLRRGC
jgi:transposase-like protein